MPGLNGKKAIGKVGSERALTHFVLAGRNHEISAHIQLSAGGKALKCY